MIGMNYTTPTELDAADDAAVCKALAEGVLPEATESQKEPEAKEPQKGETEAKQRYAVFEVMENEGERALAMVQVPPLKQALLIQSVEDKDGEIWIAALPLAQGLFALTNGESSRDDRIKAARYISRMNPATGAVLQGLVRRTDIAPIEPDGKGRIPQHVVRADGLWTFLTAIAPSKIIMATRMRLYEAVRKRFGGAPLPSYAVDDEEDKLRKRRERDELAEAETARIKESRRRLREKAQKKADRKRRPADDSSSSSSSEEEHRAKKSKKTVAHHAAPSETLRSAAPPVVTMNEDKTFEALKMLHEQQQVARTAEINDVMRLENILAAGRENKLKALREEVRLRAEMAALPHETLASSSMMMH